MYAPLEPLFWIYALYFIFAAFIAFFIPGNLIIARLKLGFLLEITLSVVIGFVAWSLQGFVFGYLNIRSLSYVYLIVCLLFWIKLYLPSLFKSIKFSRPSLTLTLLVVFGTIIQLSSVWFNGFKIGDTVFFCCGVPDTLTHLALTSELVKHFPPNEPGISGIPLYNYHYLSNLGQAELIRVFHLPLVNTSYQFMTILFSLLLGLTAIGLADVLNLGKKFKLWFVFLLYFTGDIIFLLPVFFGKGLDFSYTTLENASSLWISPPRLYSIVVFFTGLTFFTLWLKKKDITSGLLMALTLGSLIGFKVYTGAIVLSGFMILGLIYLLKRKLNLLIPIIMLCAISIGLYLPINKGAGGLIFTGFWRFEDFVVQPSLGMSNLELARRVYLENNNLLKVLFYDLFFGLIYILSGAGVLILGILQTRSSLRKLPKDLHIVLIISLLASCTAGFFFIQQTGGANSSQFLISIYLIGTIYGALAISWWQSKIPLKLGLLISVMLIILSSARVLHNTNIQATKIVNKSGNIIDSAQLESYKFFNNTRADSIVMVSDESTLDCLYIIFIGNRSTYNCLSGLPGVIEEKELIKRSNVRKNILYGHNLEEAKSLLQSNTISYLYIPKNEEKKTNVRKLGLSKVFETNAISIYKTLR